FRKWIWVPEEGGKGHFNEKIAPGEYRRAFAGWGLDLPALEPAAAARRVAASGVKAELVAAGEDWALLEPDEAVRGRLLQIARTADPGAWTDRLRDPAVWKAREALAKLATDADPGSTSPAALSVLASLMERRGLDPAPLLSAARVKYPTDFELAFVLGQWHQVNSKDGRQIGPYEAARALRPEHFAVWNNLGGSLRDRGELDAAIAAYKEAIRIDPRYAIAHYNLGLALYRKRELDAAIAALKEAIRIDPRYASAHYGLGLALRDKGELDAATDARKEGNRIDPNFAPAHHKLGEARK